MIDFNILLIISTFLKDVSPCIYSIPLIQVHSCAFSPFNSQSTAICHRREPLSLLCSPNHPNFVIIGILGHHHQSLQHKVNRLRYFSMDHNRLGEEAIR